MKKVTISDIANKLNMTPSTVSRALANNKRISESTRKKVQDTSKEMGYQPNVMAASLRKGTSDTIGMIVPRINRHFFSNVISGVEEILNPAGFNLVVIQSGELLSREVKAVESLLQNRVGGIILSLSLQTNTFEHLQDVVKHNTPLVQFDRVTKSLPGSKITNDNYTGGYLATRHLIKCGFKHVAHFSGSYKLRAYRERKAGYIAALEEAGMRVDEKLIVDDVITREAGYSQIHKLVMRTNADAVFCAGDYSALGAMEGLKSLGYHIPDQFGIVGFANEPFSELMDPSLSSVEQNALEMGNKVAAAMIKAIQKEEVPEEEVIPVRFIGRSSSWKDYK
ncbi:LacI family DNA-binding transcriptional regulator [Carboxylicivirga linearis]|uniref:LacI family DNA-binding transcriptional regulator n=1 Tax=Carboxylicivirga linearis TaxID=1628157 RepID=A0ABS5JVD1_9BACT|nr:LacI family DNA-binding transcriptional regulator [Carboxylicivirga linearis]MBS2098439.1 LacI family DNA-binding transcriptional regulator [Carboxylicivirga linearis]